MPELVPPAPGAHDSTRPIIRKAWREFARQFEGGKKPILPAEIAECMIFFDGMALAGEDAAAVLAELRAMPRADAVRLILKETEDSR